MSVVIACRLAYRILRGVPEELPRFCRCTGDLTPREGKMKPHRLLPLLVLVLSAFMLSCDSGQQTVTAPDDLQPQFAKPGANCDPPDPHPSCKPDDPASGELITFTGDLVGEETVEDCCPNAGPFPAYTMTLKGPDDFPKGPFPDGIAGTHGGHIFRS